MAGALLAYHPNGIEVFGDIPVYATEKALSNWGKGGSIRGLTDGFVATFGDGVAANLPTKANLIKTGDKVTLAGMDFVIREEGDDAYGALRISMGRYTTAEDIDRFLIAFDEALNWNRG